MMNLIQTQENNCYLSSSKTGADPSSHVADDPSEQVGLVPSSHFGGPPGLPPL